MHYCIANIGMRLFEAMSAVCEDVAWPVFNVQAYGRPGTGGPGCKLAALSSMHAHLRATAPRQLNSTSAANSPKQQSVFDAMILIACCTSSLHRQSSTLSVV